MASGPSLDALSALISVTAEPSMSVPEPYPWQYTRPTTSTSCTSLSPREDNPSTLVCPGACPKLWGHSNINPWSSSRTPPLRALCGIKCQRQCSAKFSDDHRWKIWRDFWDLTYKEKRAFVIHCVNQVPRTKVCANPSRWSRSFISRLKDAGGTRSKYGNSSSFLN